MCNGFNRQRQTSPLIKSLYHIFLYPDVYSSVFLGYSRIHQDTSGYNVLNVSWPEYRGSHRIRTEYTGYVQDTVSWRIHAGYIRIHQDTSGYRFKGKPN